MNKKIGRRASRTKPKGKLNGWSLYNGLYEVFWKDDTAIRVAIMGCQFKPVGMHPPSRGKLKSGLQPRR